MCVRLCASAHTRGGLRRRPYYWYEVQHASLTIGFGPEAACPLAIYSLRLALPQVLPQRPGLKLLWDENGPVGDASAEPLVCYWAEHGGKEVMPSP